MYYKKNPNYLGNYSIQQKARTIPMLQNNKFLILNTDTPYGEGIHWVSLYCRNNSLFYFDSFAGPIHKQINNYMKTFNFNNLYSNQYAVQDLRSNACGYFVLYFLDSMINNHKFFDFLQQFNINKPTQNEDILHTYFKSKSF